MPARLALAEPRQFSANRQVNDYITGPYMSAASAGIKLKADSIAGAKQLAAWKKNMRENWSQVKLENLVAPFETEVLVAEEMPVEATIQLGPIDPKDVTVQLYHGRIDNKGHIIEGATSDLQYEISSDGVHLFKGAVHSLSTGQYGFALRILPRHDSRATPFDANLIHWA